MIVSASRRTDLPARFSAWLVARAKLGWAYSVNPFNRQATWVSLRCEDVDVLVLWSKDFRNFDSAAATLEALGLRLYFQYTITGLPAELEAKVPPPAETIASAHRLAKRFGPKAVAWRYDPILFATGLDDAYHLRVFADLTSRLRGATDRCIVSFATFYAKVRRRLANGSALTRSVEAPDREHCRRLLSELGAIALKAGMSLEVCSHPERVDLPALPGRCIDAERFARTVPFHHSLPASLPSRPGCGCSASKDIGLYDTCPHECIYCYASSATHRFNDKSADGSNPVPCGHVEETEDGVFWKPA